MSKYFLLRFFTHTTLSFTGETYLRGTPVTNNATDNYEPNEYIIQTPDDYLDTLTFCINNICYAHKQLNSYIIPHVFVYSVSEGQTIDYNSDMGVCFASNAFYSNGNVTLTADVKATFQNYTYTYSQIGSVQYCQQSPTTKDTFDFGQNFWGNAPNGYPTGITSVPMSPLQNEPVYLRVCLSRITGRAKRLLIPAALTASDYSILANGRLELSPMGALGRWRWQRYKRTMVPVLPFLAPFTIKDDKLIPQSAHGITQTPVNVQFKRMIKRHDLETNYSKSAFTFQMHRILEAYLLGLNKIYRYLQVGKLDTSTNINVAPGISDCRLYMEFIYRQVLSTLGFDVSYTTESGLQSIYPASQDVVKSTYSQLDFQLVQDLLDGILSYMKSFDELIWFDVTTSQIYLAQTIRHSTAYDTTTPQLYANRNLKTTWDVITPIVKSNSAIITSNYPKLIDIVFTFVRMFAYIDKKVKFSRVMGDSPTIGSRVDRETDSYITQGEINQTAVVKGYQIVENAPTPLNTTRYDASTVLTGKYTFENVPQLPSLIDNRCKSNPLYGFIEPPIPQFVLVIPNFPDKKDDSEEGEEGEFPWVPIIIPITPEEKNAETDQMVDQIADNLIAVTDAAGIVAAAFTDGAVVPEEAVAKPVVDGLIDGAVRWIAKPL